MMHHHHYQPHIFGHAASADDHEHELWHHHHGDDGSTLSHEHGWSPGDHFHCDRLSYHDDNDRRIADLHLTWKPIDYETADHEHTT